MGYPGRVVEVISLYREYPEEIELRSHLERRQTDEAYSIIERVNSAIEEIRILIAKEENETNIDTASVINLNRKADKKTLLLNRLCHIYFKWVK